MRRIFLSVLCSAVLAGCASGPDFERPVAPDTDRYTEKELRTAPNTPATGAEQQVMMGEQLTRDWWKLFQSDAIDDVVRRALTGNRTLAAAEATLAQARELANAQAGGRAPRVDLTGGSGRQKYGAEFLGTLPKPPAFTYFAVGAAVSYNLDLAGGLSRAVEQKLALVDYQRQQLAAAYLAVTGSAVMQALKIASLQAQIRTVEAILDQDRENLKLVQKAFDAGSVSRLDIVSAQSQLATDGTLLPPLRQEMDIARHALAIVLGELPAKAKLPEFDLSKLELPRRLLVSLPSELAHRRPDILAAEAQLHAATASVGIATANLYPRIDITASAGQQSTELGHVFDGASSVWSLIGGLVAPVFDGGRLRAEQRASVEAMRSSAAGYEQAVLTAFGQVADALRALQHDAEQLDAQARAEEAASANADLTRKSYHEGNVNVLQVLDAERSYQRARLGYVRAQAQRYLDTVQLFLALGGSGPDGPAADGKS